MLRNKNVFRGKVKMFCFNQKTYIVVAENVSATFLRPENLLQNAPRITPCEEKKLFSAPILASLSGDTPADVLIADAVEQEYQIKSGYSECSLAVSNPLDAEEDAFIPENIVSGDVITVGSELREDYGSVFYFKKHIPPGFYITVCNKDYLLSAVENVSAAYSKYCCSVQGFVPSGMKLKIVIQSFNL